MDTTGNTLLTTAVVIATVASALLAGIAFYRMIIDLPARHKIGVLAYADYARASDLGNGFFVYPVLAIGGVLAKAAAFVVAVSAQASSQLLIPLGLAVVFGLGVLVTTAFAAPQMLKIGRTENREELISPLLERFVRYSNVRAVVIWLDFTALLWALIVL